MVSLPLRFPPTLNKYLPVCMSLERQAHWPVLAVWLAVLLLMPMQERVVYEHTWLLGAGFLFGALVAIFVAVWMGGSFVRNGSPGMLLLSCGAFFWGTAGLIFVLSIFLGNDIPVLDINTLVTQHNTCAWLAAITQLAGAAISCIRMEPVARPRTWLTVTYVGTAAILALLIIASSSHWTPLFFVLGQGGTATRYLVLGSAIGMFLLAALLLFLAGRRDMPPFLRWYSLALVLMAAGLTGLLLPKVTGTPASWAARSAHYCSALYMLAAVFRSWPGFSPEHTLSREDVFAPKQRWLLSFAVAVACSSGAAVLRVFFLQNLGQDVSYVTFCFAVALAALMGGSLPGIMTTLLSGSLTFSIWLASPKDAPFNVFTLVMELTFFVLSGLLVSLVGQMTHRYRARSVLVEAKLRQEEEQVRVAEKNVQATNERLAHVVEAAMAGIWDWNIQTGELIYNERWAEMAGYHLADQMAMKTEAWRESVHPDDLPVLQKQLDELFAGARPLYDQEYRLRHRDGHWIWVQDWGRISEWSEEGKPLLMTGFHIDISARKLAEAQLRDLSREQQILLGTVPIGIAKYIDRKLIWCNQGFEEMLGYPWEEVYQKSTRRFFPSLAEYEDLGKATSPVLAQGLIYEGELRLQRKDGNLIYVRISGRAVDPADSSQGSIWAIQDISERKLMEEAIRERAELFQALFADSHSVKLLIDPDNGSIIDANKAASDFYGYPIEQLITMHVSEINVLDRAEIRAKLAMVKERQGEAFQFRHRLASGEIRDVEEYFSSIQIAGRIVLHSIVHDITEKKRLEDSLRESQALLHSMTESTSDSVYIKDWAGRYLMCNRAASRRFGHLESEILGKDDRAFFPSKQADELMERDRGILASGEVWTYEESITLANQEYIFLSTKGPVRNASGAIIGLFGVSRDITDRKHVEEELQRSREAAVAANHAKTKLLSTAAHEFRTPLSLLQSSLDILDRYGGQLDEEERKTQKRHIRSATRQLTDLAESLLAYRNVERETGKQAESVPCDIGMLSRTIAEETQAAKAAGHEFIVAIGEECGLLLIDPALYRRVLENLLANAFQYTPPDRQVSLELVKAGDWLRMTVADQGIGIEQGDLERIFDPFFRGSNVGQRRGIGLGLPIIHESLSRMDGRISITSTPGHGTRFEISLPWLEVEDEEDEPRLDEPEE
ncbi:PAS domain S-box protein [Desulfobulbus sp.]|uniref:PAS domain-containing sensor histidine kinase n=1 Tax=Desulfobulbus sp. TaxID=895 RepID=UPI00286F8673|nr:PAS domain S-box protein [Desulfobulbus sp.]